LWIEALPDCDGEKAADRGTVAKTLAVIIIGDIFISEFARLAEGERAPYKLKVRFQLS
jgi:hypothetical protein